MLPWSRAPAAASARRWRWNWCGGTLRPSSWLTGPTPSAIWPTRSINSPANASLPRPMWATCRMTPFGVRSSTTSTHDGAYREFACPPPGLHGTLWRRKWTRPPARRCSSPIEDFRRVLEINLVAPVYWALEMVGRIAEDRHARGLSEWQPEEDVQGTVIFIGSVSSRGNKGQIAYAATKAGLEGAAATLTLEAMYHGVRCGVIHPGFTDTPMVQALGDRFVQERILPHTQLKRLIRPEEIADAICFMIANSAVSGELWADAGWHPDNRTSDGAVAAQDAPQHIRTLGRSGRLVFRPPSFLA